MNAMLENPDTAECLEYVMGVTGQFLELYTAEILASSDVPLLPHPDTMSETGDVSVSALAGVEQLARHSGKSGILLGKLTLVNFIKYSY